LPVLAIIKTSTKLDFQEIEYAGFRAWPAFEESEADGVVLRYSHGHTKRANSANILLQQKGDYATLVRRCEGYFKDKNLPCIFRLPSFCNNQQLDSYLELMGYKSMDRSLILYRSLEYASFDSPEFSVKSSHEWLESYCQISAIDISSHEAHLKILNRIKDKVLMAVLVENEMEVACGIGVISNGYFGLFDLATEKSARNMGYGTKLLNGMLSWALTNGATKAYLQVVANNQPAISLYKKMGYRPCYEYWYRIGSKAN
jgi:GNAT superfamily N-acetyltransferase